MGWNTKNTYLHQQFMHLHEATQLQKLDELELSTAFFIRLEHDIVWIRYKDLTEEFDLSMAREHTKVLGRLTGGQPVHVIIDFRDLDMSFSNEARFHFAQNEQHSALRLSQALILSSLAHRIVANFYLKFNKPNCPARIFGAPADALEWIASLK